MRKFFTLILTALISIPVITNAESLTIAWRIKPPHQYIENGVEKGILLDRARQVFADAKIVVRFSEEPAKRIWNNFTIGTQNYCSFGWYKIPEREALVQFSNVFHTDPPHTLLVSQVAAAQVTAHKTLGSLLSDSSLTLGVVEGVSYGEAIDSLIKTSQNNQVRSSAAPMIMARMVGANRASFMFIDREDWEYLHDKEDSMRETLQIDLKGMPPGLNRYIVCSKDVSAETMRKINLSLAKLLAVKR
ncbi:hypothetical protein ACO0K3_17705 [Undibacterium sp. Rencai35W]|uniref:hypothetical protein n=1 Tax=Undibacterium sp. Rencai35W TaxID=3413046 RepID=UPI003BF2F83D